MPAGLAKQTVEKYFTKYQNSQAKISPMLQDKIKEDKLQNLSEMTQEGFQADSFNEAVREKYTWSYKYNEVIVNFHHKSFIN